MANNKEIEVRRNENNSPAMLDLMPEFDEMVQRFFGPRFNSLFGDLPMVVPRTVTNIQETDQQYILSAEVPGIPKEEIEINVSGNLLTVRAEHKQVETAGADQKGMRRQYRSFQQSFALPTNVDPDQIEAHCENGVLEVLLPKTAQSQPKKIEVQSGKGSILNRLMGKSDDKSVSQNKDSAKH